MPKSQYIDPTQMRKPGEITFTPIPVNQYNKTVKDELKAKHFTKDDLKRIYRDMVVIREFETMLQLVKTTGGYNGVEYNNPGPAHLSAGQEAAAVGMAYMLEHQRLHFRIAPQPRRNSRQGSARDRAAGRQEPREDHERASSGRRHRKRRQEGVQGRHDQRAGYPLPALRGAGRGIRPHDRIQQGSGRQYAHASSRRSASIRTTRSWAAAAASPWAQPSIRK